MSYLTDEEIGSIKVEHEINPWAFALGLSGWIWAAIWFAAWVMA